jgi:hypothetical protein
MNTIRASAPPARIRPLALGAKVCRKLGSLIAPRDHAGKGNWDTNADIPWYAWPGALAFAAFFFFGPQALGWLVRLIV